MTAAQASELTRWKARLDAAWAEACWWEGIAPTSQFVVFSEGNPGAEKHSQLTFPAAKAGGFLTPGGDRS